MTMRMLQWESNSGVEQVREALENDQIVLGTSDTVLGLLANTTQKSFDKLNEIKQRDYKPYLHLIDSADKLKTFSHRNVDVAMKLAKQFWPGPLTLIVQARPDLPDYLKSAGGTVALRVPDHQGLLELLKSFPSLFSTSANLSGQPVPESIEQVDPLIKEKCSLIILDESIASQPSTIIDCSGEHITVVREGLIPIHEIEKVIGPLKKK